MTKISISYFNIFFFIMRTCWALLIFILYNFSFWSITYSFSETLRNVFSGDCHRLHVNFTWTSQTFKCHQSQNTFLKVSEKLCVTDQKLKLYKMKISTAQHIGIPKKKYQTVRNSDLCHLCSFSITCDHFWIAEKCYAISHVYPAWNLEKKFSFSRLVLV